MAKKKQEEKESVIPAVCYCKRCENGGKTEDFKVWYSIKKIWQHSPVSCSNYIEKQTT